MKSTFAVLLFLALFGLSLGRSHTKEASDPTVDELEVLPVDVGADNGTSDDPVSSTLKARTSNTTLNDRASVVEMVGMAAAGIAAELSKRCIYGKYCGSACHAKAGSSRPGGLDGHCWDHDRCLSNPNYVKSAWYCSAPGLSGMKCTCEKRLASAAWSIYNNGKRCSWWQVWCTESTQTLAAWAVARAMDQRKRCGNC